MTYVIRLNLQQKYQPGKDKNLNYKILLKKFYIKKKLNQKKTCKKTQNFLN